MIELKELSAGYGRQAVLSGVSMEFTPGKVLALLGPNGCGKSTPLKTILCLQPKLAGEILVDGTPAHRLTPRQLAQKLTYLAQSRNAPNISVRRMVLHGRFPYLSYPRRYRQEDYEMVAKALDRAGAGDLANCAMETLSEGQRQKVYLAMALAQNTETILMDEPTTFLDVARQLEVMAVARRLASEGKAVLMVLHDLCLALRWADETALLADGKLLFRGTPEEAFKSGALDLAFGIRLARVMTESGWQYYYQ